VNLKQVDNDLKFNSPFGRVMYKEPFYLTGKQGNNAFAYEARGPEPKLYVPSIIEGSLEDVQVGEEVVFSDHDDEGVLQACKGLKRFVRTSYKGVPLVVVDNHNHVFYFWYEALAAGLLQRGATLIHIDAHKDARVPEKPFSGGSLEEVFRYTNEDLNVGNYIPPAQQEGLLGEVEFVTSEAKLDEGNFFERGNKILNVDLDFFAPDFSYISFEKGRDYILKQAERASLITVATSPFFIEQDEAIRRLHQLFSPQ
jgi:hypothetical protein